MSTKTDSAYRAADAEADTRDDQDPDRPATDAERAYLTARVEDTAAAVGKIKAQIRGLERSLRDAEKLHADAKRAAKAGRDLPDVQARRAE